MKRGLAGVVLAGGLSRRFGRDKAAESFRGRALIEWSIAALEPRCDVIFVAGRDHPPYLCVGDRPDTGLGPLGGIAGALHAAAGHGCKRLLVLPCDTPIVPPQLLDELCAAGRSAYLAHCPAIGLWQVSDREALDAFLSSDVLHSIRGWARTVGAIRIEGFDDIPNVNSVADLTALDH